MHPCCHLKIHHKLQLPIPRCTSCTNLQLKILFIFERTQSFHNVSSIQSLLDPTDSSFSSDRASKCSCSGSTNCKMSRRVITGWAVRVACLYYLSQLAGCALVGSSRIMSWSFAASSPGRLLEQHGSSPVVRTPYEVSQERRSLRNVHVSPDAIGNVTTGGGGGGLRSSAGVGIVVVLSVSLVLISVAVLVFWCCRTKKKRNDPQWKTLLGSFKRRKFPEMDEEELYAQAKDDTHLTGY